MTPRILGSAPIVGSVLPPVPPNVRLRKFAGRGEGELRVRFVVMRVLSSLEESRGSAMMSSPGQAGSITRVSNTPLCVSRTIVDEAVAESGAPEALVSLIQTPPRLLTPAVMAPPILVKATGPIVLGVEPSPGREKTRNSPGLSTTSAGI